MALACLVTPLERNSAREVILYSTRALHMDGISENGSVLKPLDAVAKSKALYRRSLGYLGTGEIEDALRDLEVAEQLQPEDAGIVKKKVEVNKLVKARRDKQKQAMSKLFSD